jgi:hypothetical protein
VKEDEGTTLQAVGGVALLLPTTNTQQRRRQSEQSGGCGCGRVWTWWAHTGVETPLLSNHPRCEQVMPPLG